MWFVCGTSNVSGFPSRRQIVTFVSDNDSAHISEPYTASRHTNPGVFSDVAIVAVAPLRNASMACVVSPVSNGSTRLVESALTRAIGPTRNENASSRWMPMPVMPPAFVSCGAERQLSSGVFARMSWL